MNKRKLVKVVLLAILVILGLSGVGYALESSVNQEERYVKNMLAIIDEVDAEMKELSKSSMSDNMIKKFANFAEEKQKTIEQTKIPKGLPQSVKDNKENLYAGIGYVRNGALANDTDLVETGQLHITMAQMAYEDFLNGNVQDTTKTDSDDSKATEENKVDKKKAKWYHGQWVSTSTPKFELTITEDEVSLTGTVEGIEVGGNSEAHYRQNHNKDDIELVDIGDVILLFDTAGMEDLMSDMYDGMGITDAKGVILEDSEAMEETGEDAIRFIMTPLHSDGTVFEDSMDWKFVRNDKKTSESTDGGQKQNTKDDESSKDKEKTSQSQSEPFQMPRDPAEVAGTGTPKGYNEFNTDQQKAIGRAVDAVTNNVGVDRTIYNYTYEPDILTGLIYIGRFNGTELMDVLSVDDKLLDYKGYIDADMFDQKGNQSLEQFVSGYSVPSSNCTLGVKDGRVVLYFVMEEQNRSNGNEQKMQQYIELTRRVSNDVATHFKSGVPVSLQEPFENDYSVTFVDGQPTSATPAYQTVIDGLGL